MKILKAIAIIIVFVLGALSTAIYAELAHNPAVLVPMGVGSPSEVPSPGDRIKEDQIKVYNDRVIIELKNAQWASFTDTKSMDPVIDSGANAIQIVPSCPDDVHVGDIVSYNSKYASGTIIHRVVAKGYDENGVYFVMKGDNNPTNDPGRIRCDQILRVVVAIIY